MRTMRRATRCDSHFCGLHLARPDADRGHHHFSYALYPHGGDWQHALTVPHGSEFNYILEAQQVTAKMGHLPTESSYVSVAANNVVLTALKKAEDQNELILRMYEWAGKSGDVVIHVPDGAGSETVTNLMEKPEGPALIVSNGNLKLRIHPYEILTLRVDYPLQR